jgi:hypothetical protein
MSLFPLQIKKDKEAGKTVDYTKSTVVATEAASKVGETKV